MVLYILLNIRKQVMLILFIHEFTISRLGVKVAVKAMQKGRIQDYEAFKNEIAILKQLVRYFILINCPH